MVGVGNQASPVGSREDQHHHGRRNPRPHRRWRPRLSGPAQPSNFNHLCRGRCVADRLHWGCATCRPGQNRHDGRGNGYGNGWEWHRVQLYPQTIASAPGNQGILGSLGPIAFPFHYKTPQNICSCRCPARAFLGERQWDFSFGITLPLPTRRNALCHVMF